ncbi:hypothetical protein [Novosphingobium sp.]|uniref:hypothetical protein n=1 Tax=Novosphingobium sp. TaxID=1874826 RepID=UPI0025E6CA8B|nr:hypothetical protein [Novosphingobium sp.]
MMIELKKSDAFINTLLALAEEIADEEERRVVRKRIANVMGEIYCEIWRPIEIEHPSLRESDEAL